MCPCDRAMKLMFAVVAARVCQKSVPANVYSLRPMQILVRRQSFKVFMLIQMK